MITSVTSRSIVQMMGQRPSMDCAVISLGDPGDRVPVPLEGWGGFLRVVVDDVTFDRESIVRMGHVFLENGEEIPRRRHAIAIREFLSGLKSHNHICHLIVHSWDGASRSVAVAKYAALYFDVRFDHGNDRYNHMIFELLQDPGCYDAAWQQNAVAHPSIFPLLI